MVVCVCGGVLWAIIADNLWDIRDTRIGEREKGKIWGGSQDSNIGHRKALPPPPPTIPK